MAKFNLVLLIHAHQPVGNFDEVMERTYERSYLPFVECVARHPRVRLGLHYTGSLLEWIAEKHPEYIQRLRGMVARGQVEIAGGGFYEPILIAIPHEDRIEQIYRLSLWIEEQFGKRPVGAWLAERVWEPQLPAVLAEAGVEYTLVDDSHFLMAGREIPELFGYYVSEECGKTVKVIPGLQELRYLLPFGSVEDSVAFLRRSANDHPSGMAAMGDDMEKFGAWPHTYEHCYRDGWLDRFFTAVEASQEWLEMVPPSEALAARPPLGRVDLPTASYTEMMEWVLPTSVRQKFHALLDEFSGRPDVRRFLRGGFWRGFFSKYAEANLLHKKMLRVSSKLRSAGARGPRRATKRASLRDKAITHLMRSQCNDAYWHGIFGGLYAPHLRTALWRELVRAETIADELHHDAKPYQALTRLDFDVDGREEIEITSPKFAAIVKPSDGGTLSILDFRPSAVTLINSLQRRVEAYHARLQNAAQFAAKVASIHDQTLTKEPGLEKRLKYDRWARNAFRLLLFAPGKTHGDYEALHLEEGAAFAGGDYQIENANAKAMKLSLEAPLRQVIATADSDCILRVAKVLHFDSHEHGFDVRCRIDFAPKGIAPPAPGHSGPAQFTVGLEVVLNLLAPNVPDRYIEFAGGRQPLEWSGVIDGPRVRVADEWQDVAVEIEARGASQLWISPIETVSESEEGFERVYQGSQILGVWNVTLDPGQPWSAETVLHVSAARSA
ncbi:MAG TPA: alpha-amylase/4-alpha-glucanotransferase domain-containing protein [Candidatus Acidoferrales bacterium]|nr:alpha-amylase/4-alpha-glucanotransferase domain-containing protein [Candidatus Acidoferrales bacterium]